MSNVKVVKLKSGEELVATVTDADSTHLVLKKPCILVQTAENQIGMAPWGFMCKEATSGDGISIAKTDVLFVGTPIDELWNQYNSVFGSKLVVPDKTVTNSNDSGLKLAF